MAAASSIVLSSRWLRLMTVRNRNFSIKAPRIASVTPEASEADDERQAELAVDRIGDEAAQHIHLPVREIEHVHQCEDQGQTQCDQRILGAEIEAVDDDLFHTSAASSGEG